MIRQKKVIKKNATNANVIIIKVKGEKENSLYINMNGKKNIQR